MIVADSNLIASCVLESSATEDALRLRQSDPDWRVPQLWRYEVLNIMSTMIKAGRLDKHVALTLYSGLMAALVPVEHDSSAKAVLDLVSAYGITGYDAQFVALAIELDCTLYTQDKELLEKFPAIAKPFYVKGSQVALQPRA